MKKIIIIVLSLAMITSSHIFVFAENGETEYPSYIDIGNADSEGSYIEYTSASEPQTRTVDGTGHTYRTLGIDGSMTFSLKCDSDNTNYLTVKLWGGDTGEGMLWLTDENGNMNISGDGAPARNSGVVDRRDWVELNFLGSSPQFDGGFIYSTYIIPAVYTEGKENVTLKIYSTGGSADYADVKVKEQTEPSRGIYALYMTQDAYFEPAEHEKVTGRLAETAAADTTAYGEQKKIALKYVKDAVETFKSWQIYGQDNYPSYMEGMITRRTDWNTKNKTDDDWKDIFYNDLNGMLKQNMTPLDGYELFALAYENSEALGYDETEKSELLDRLVRGFDFLVRAQGHNGGFFSKYGWIGGPERVDADGNNLTGFGLRSVAKALFMVYDDIQNGGYLNKYIDSDGDGEQDTTRRKAAWENMITSARDYLVSLDGAGHAPNQDMADIIAALRFNKVLELMESDSAWEQSEITNLLDIALGFKPNISTSSYWVSPKGLILENFGSIQGGYSGDYGINALEEMSQLAEIAGEYLGENAEKYIDIVNKAYEASANFMFTANALTNGEPTLYSEGLTGNRNANYPGTVRYVLDEYAALSLKNQTALEAYEKFLNHNRLEVAEDTYKPSNAHFEDNALSVMRLYLDFDSVANALADAENYDYIMEDNAVDEYAWADEMGRNVVIKNGSDKIYIALNWRNPIHSTKYYNTATQKDEQSGLMNNLARVHHITDRFDRYGYAEITTEGWNVKTATSSDWQKFTNHYAEAFMYMDYGSYKIIMNSNNLMGAENNISYDIPYEELNLNGVYKDLISGKRYYFGEAAEGAENGKIAKVAPASTMVLYQAEPEGEVTVQGVEYEGNTAKVSLTSTGGSSAVTVYAAEYDGEKRLVKIEQKKQTARGIDEITLPFEKSEAGNKVKIFVWDKAMKPLYEAREW